MEVVVLNVFFWYHRLHLMELKCSTVPRFEITPLFVSQHFYAVQNNRFFYFLFTGSHWYAFFLLVILWLF